MVTTGGYKVAPRQKVRASFCLMDDKIGGKILFRLKEEFEPYIKRITS